MGFGSKYRDFAFENIDGTLKKNKNCGFSNTLAGFDFFGEPIGL